MKTILVLIAILALALPVLAWAPNTPIYTGLDKQPELVWFQTGI